MTDDLTSAKTKESRKFVDEFLMEDYKLKVRYLSDHFTRMWTRFNFFIVLQTALSVAFANLLREGDLPRVGREGVVILGLITSAVWYVFGVQDRFLVETYRSQIRYVLIELFQGRPLPKGFGLSADAGGNSAESKLTYPYTGSTVVIGKIQPGISQRRVNAFSTTRLAALVPLIAIVLWLLVGVWIVRG